MSNPADNTEGCEVCGLDRQVLGCRPGKCAEGPHCAYPGCTLTYRQFHTSIVQAGHDYVEGPPLDRYPLPWRWEGSALVDADGYDLITGTDEPGACEPRDPYVRAVTERAGAMEVLLRRWLLENDSYLGSRAKELAAQAPAWARVVDTAKMTVALLAEIDAAKAGG